STRFFQENHNLINRNFLKSKTRFPSSSSRPNYSSANFSSTTFTRTQGRTNLPLAASPPSLWRYIGPTPQNCQQGF
ncbi:hypothetical protein, partial [Ochrobactrum sp. Q0168]|uniref:hypothetical protein n=1 Tax=Ochrobactrum sp. Q0168 TaxID=2793241 RepID=UPI001AEE2804